MLASFKQRLLAVNAKIEQKQRRFKPIEAFQAKALKSKYEN